MKRDLDLVRCILLTTESADGEVSASDGLPLSSYTHLPQQGQS